MSEIEPHIIKTNVRVVTAALAAAPDVLLEEMVPAVTEGQLLLEREVKERTPTYMGTLRDSIGALPVTLGEASITGTVGTALSYALPVELGSRPHRPPIEPLAEWVARKLGKKDEEGRGIAFAIAAKIAKSGTTARHMFEDGLAATQAQIHELLAAAAERGLRRVAP